MIALIATIVHEVPHEFSDFALLLRDGYSRKKAICFQVNFFNAIHLFEKFSILKRKHFRIRDKLNLSLLSKLK